jgi:hypothetical protein
MERIAKQELKFRMNGGLHPRLFDLIDKTGDCWKWRGSHSDNPVADGYPVRWLTFFSVYNRFPRKHTLSCGNPSCLSPEHVVETRRHTRQPVDVSAAHYHQSVLKGWRTKRAKKAARQGLPETGQKKPFSERFEDFLQGVRKARAVSIPATEKLGALD